MVCDLSGFRGWDDEMRETWDGKWVLKQFWESRHPQDFVRGKSDKQSVPNSQPETADVFICSGMYEPDVFEFESPALYVTCVEN